VPASQAVLIVDPNSLRQAANLDRLLVHCATRTAASEEANFVRQARRAERYSGL